MITQHTIYPALGAAIGIPELYIKREDEHPYGSHKGRSIPLMIHNSVRDEYTNFVISSSGNAALAAMIAISKYNNTASSKLTLTVYIGNNIPAKKKEKLHKYINEQITLNQVDRPKQAAFQHAKELKGCINLRQSMDDSALFGYHELAYELTSIENLSAIFVPTSSGTTAQGIAEGLERKFKNPQIHIAQTSSCHPIADEFYTYSKTNPTEIVQKEISHAGAIVDRVAHRKMRVAEIIAEYEGSAWIISNQELTEAIALVKEYTDITVSANSALSIAAAKKAAAAGWKFDGAVVCLVCGE